MQIHQCFRPLKTLFIAKWSRRPLAESKTNEYEDLQRKEIKLAEIIQPFGWDEFVQIEEIVYPNVVRSFHLRNLVAGEEFRFSVIYSSFHSPPLPCQLLKQLL